MFVQRAYCTPNKSKPKLGLQDSERCLEQQGQERWGRMDQRWPCAWNVRTKKLLFGASSAMSASAGATLSPVWCGCVGAVPSPKSVSIAYHVPNHVSQPRFGSEREVALGHCTVVGGCHVRSPGPFSRSYTLFVSLSLARCDDCDAFPGNTLSLLRSLSLSLSCHSVTRSLWLSLSHSPSTGPLVLPGRATRCNTARESDGSIRTPHFSGELGVVFPFPSFTNEMSSLRAHSLRLSVHRAQSTSFLSTASRSRHSPHLPHPLNPCSHQSLHCGP